MYSNGMETTSLLMMVVVVMLELESDMELLAANAVVWNWNGC